MYPVIKFQPLTGGKRQCNGEEEKEKTTKKIWNYMHAFSNEEAAE